MRQDHVFRIRHIESGNFFVTRKGKSIWNRESDCKTAFSHQCGTYFDDDTAHEIVRFRLVEQKKAKDKEKPSGYYYQK